MNDKALDLAATIIGAALGRLLAHLADRALDELADKRRAKGRHLRKPKR